MSWLSKALEKSQRKGTGVFSWGDSDYAKGLDVLIPGAGTAIDSGLDKLADYKGNGTNVNPTTAINTASFISNNQTALMIVGALVAYKVFFK